MLHAHVTTAAPSLPGIAMELVEVPGTPAQFGATLGELTLLLNESAEGTFHGFIEYATELYDESRIVRLARHLETLLVAVLADPELRLSRLSLATPEERSLPTRSVEQSSAPGLLERLAARVERADAVAISAGTRRLTWRELAARARGLAARLKGEGVGPEVPVALRMEPSVEAVIALWGVLEAGGACLPSRGEVLELTSLLPAQGPRLLLVARTLADASSSLPARRERRGGGRRGRGGRCLQRRALRAARVHRARARGHGWAGPRHADPPKRRMPVVVARRESGSGRG